MLVVDTHSLEVAVYRQDPIADSECAHAVADILKTKHHTRILSHKQLTTRELKNIDCLVFPGGLGDADAFDDLLYDKKKVVQQFFKSGKTYMGICMGAYIAGEQYFNIVPGVSIDQYIKRKHSDIHTEDPTIVKCRWADQLHIMYFFDGPAFWGKISPREKIATYSNGDAAAIFKKTSTGTFIGIGPHPESRFEWYNKVTSKFWHQKEQHKLILDVLDKVSK